MFKQLWRKKGVSYARGRVGIAVDVQGLCAVKLIDPLAARPRIEACAIRPVTGEGDWGPALAELVQEIEAEDLPAVAALSPPYASLHQIGLPEVPEAEMAGALKFRAHELSPIPLDDMVLDYIDIPGMRARAGERLGYCAIARLSQLRALRDAIKAAGMQLEAIDIKDMALRHLLGRFQPAEENGVLLFVGLEESRIIVARGELLYLFRSSPLGARQLQQGSLAQAEPQAQQRVEGLVLEIQRTLDFFDSHFTDPPPRHIWLAPDWPFMASLMRLLQGQLRLPLHVIALPERFDGSERLAGLVPDVSLLALGAALRPPQHGHG